MEEQIQKPSKVQISNFKHNNVIMVNLMFFPTYPTVTFMELYEWNMCSNFSVRRH